MFSEDDELSLLEYKSYVFCKFWWALVAGHCRSVYLVHNPLLWQIDAKYRPQKPLTKIASVFKCSLKLNFMLADARISTFTTRKIVLVIIAI